LAQEMSVNLRWSRRSGVAFAAAVVLTLLIMTWRPAAQTARHRDHGCGRSDNVGGWGATGTNRVGRFQSQERFHRGRRCLRRSERFRHHLELRRVRYLQRQIEAGAPVDVFASAAMKQMTALADQDLVDPESCRYSQAMRSCWWSVRVETGDIHLRRPHVGGCEEDRLRRSQGCSPRGRRRGDTHHAGYLRAGPAQGRLRAERLPGPGVRCHRRGRRRHPLRDGSEGWRRQGEDSSRFRPNLHSSIAYPIALVTSGEAKDLGSSFIAYVMSPEGQSILQKHGFLPAPAP